MPAIAFNRYYRYDDLTQILKALADEHPNLLRLESIGKSHEGREVWLVTYVTKKAVNKKVARGVICEIEIPKGATLQSGKVREEFAQLEGRAYKSAFAEPSEGGTDDRLKVEWVVHAPKGGTVKLVARHERAGAVRAELALRP
jgi:hypothetical protein